MTHNFNVSRGKRRQPETSFSVLLTLKKPIKQHVGAIWPNLSEVLEDKAGGEGGIRTPDRVAPMPHFECGAFNHSATSPSPQKLQSALAGCPKGFADWWQPNQSSGRMVPLTVSGSALQVFRCPERRVLEPQPPKTRSMWVSMARATSSACVEIMKCAAPAIVSREAAATLLLNSPFARCTA